MLEIIATCKNDIVSLNEMNIDRIELCNDMEFDGLSPLLNVVKSCLEISEIPIRVMLRVTPDFLIHDNLDFYLEYISALKKLNNKNLEGIVLGFLKNNCIDYQVCDQLINHAYPLKVTFHKAAEILIENNELENLRKLFHKHDNLDALLTQGGFDSIDNNIETLNYLNSMFPILIGGGVVEDNFDVLYDISHNIHIGSAVRLEKKYSNNFNYEILNKFIKKNI